MMKFQKLRRTKFSGAKAFVKENKGRYECGGYIYSGEGQELGQFWAKLNVGNTLLYDMIANRITIDEVRAENGCLRLMKNLVWEYDALPHALIAGGTGGGKTYFLLTLIEALLHTNAVLYILDPKNSDLADLGTVMPNVYHTKEEMIDCVNAFYEGMVRRSEEMKRHPNYKTGENYAYLGLPPCFLIFDEYVAFLKCWGRKKAWAYLAS